MKHNKFRNARVPFGNASFMRLPVRELAGMLRDAAGQQEARGFIATVGARVGNAAIGAQGSAPVEETT